MHMGFGPVASGTSFITVLEARRSWSLRSCSVASIHPRGTSEGWSAPGLSLCRYPFYPCVLVFPEFAHPRLVFP